MNEKSEQNCWSLIHKQYFKNLWSQAVVLKSDCPFKHPVNLTKNIDGQASLPWNDPVGLDTSNISCDTPGDPNVQPKGRAIVEGRDWGALLPLLKELLQVPCMSPELAVSQGGLEISLQVPDDLQIIHSNYH